MFRRPSKPAGGPSKNKKADRDKKPQPKETAPEDAVGKFPQTEGRRLEPFEEQILEANDNFLGPGVARPVDPGAFNVIEAAVKAEGMALVRKFETEVKVQREGAIKRERAKFYKEHPEVKKERAEYYKDV